MKKLILAVACLFLALGVVHSGPNSPRTFIRTITTNAVNGTFTRGVTTFPTYSLTWTTTNATIACQQVMTNALAAGDKVRLAVVTNILDGDFVVSSVSAGTNVVLRNFRHFDSGTASDTNGTLTVMLEYNRATMLGMKSGSATNTGSVYLGSTAGAQPYEIAAGGIVQFIPHGPHQLNDWFLRVATSGDGIVVIFWP